MGMREYENLKDLVITEEREKIMDIFCAAWDGCRNMGHCKDCPDRQMLKEKFSLLECFSLKYSRMLIEAGYDPVVRCKDCIYWRGDGVSVNCIADGLKTRFASDYCSKTVRKTDNADRCVCCGDVIPEGRQVCPKCGK